MANQQTPAEGTSSAKQQASGGRRPSSCSPSSDYVPYGPEWEAELMKLPKKFLIPMLRNALLDKGSLMESCVLLSKLAAPTPQFFNPLHAIAAVKLRDKFLSENA